MGSYPMELDDTYIRPCVCGEEDPVDTPKTFCYVEGTQLDKSTADNIEDLSENVWYGAKPPRLFKGNIKPLVTARQVQISRILMSGKRAKVIGTADEDDAMKQKVFTGVIKKRSAKKLLSSTRIDEV